jgi:type I restriction enzyme S subunit
MSSKKKPSKAGKTRTTARKAERTDSDFSLPNSPASQPQPGLVPKLRFPEFWGTGAWHQAPIGRLLLSSPDYGVNAAAVPFSEQLPKYLRITDISEDGRYRPEKQVSVDIEPTDSNYLEEGDIVLARTGASVGKSYQYRKEDGRLVFAGFLIRVRPHPEKLSSAYLANYLRTDTYWNWVAATSARSGQPGINSVEYASLEIPLPAVFSEQQKIASCLSSLDELIAAQARKLEALRTHKKALMQQLFPRDGETTPRLRFPEFQDAGEWATTTLGRVARLRNGYAFKSADYVTDGPYQIITITNVQQGHLSLESTKRISTIPSDIQEHQVLRLEDILISLTGNVGRVCMVTAENLLLNQRVGKLVPEQIEEAFFYQFLQREQFRSTMQLKAAGGAQGNLSAGDITEYVFCTPTNTAEQRRIAACLGSLDDLITAQTQKLGALRTHKKALMQQLFPTPEEVEA